jgi:glutamine amidotransferase
MLAVVDYGLGNLRSICAALERLEIEYKLTSDRALIRSAKGLILPGVGAFPNAMENLRRLDLVDLLNELVLDGRRPILGICLGFQIMAREGHEFGRVDGLGWLNARVVRMEQSGTDIRVPHMGWNDCIRVKQSPLFADIPEQALFYFTHSYHMECMDEADVVAVSDHGRPFVAAVQKGHVFGTQFHPEKSQLHGIGLLRNFARKVVEAC